MNWAHRFVVNNLHTFDRNTIYRYNPLFIYHAGPVLSLDFFFMGGVSFKVCEEEKKFWKMVYMLINSTLRSETFAIKYKLSWETKKKKISWKGTWKNTKPRIFPREFDLTNQIQTKYDNIIISIWMIYEAKKRIYLKSVMSIRNIFLNPNRSSTLNFLMILLKYPLSCLLLIQSI